MTHNAHFIGAEAVRKHGNPAENIHSLQIEMNRSLYMNEATSLRSENLPEVGQHLKTLAARIADHARAKG